MSLPAAWETPIVSYCRHISILLLDLTVAAVIHLSHYELSWGVFCFLINGWCQIVSDREAGKASGNLCVCVCVCVHVYMPMCIKLRPLAVTPVLITLQPEQPQALSPLLLLQPSSSLTLFHSCSLSSLSVFIPLSLSLHTYSIFPTVPPTYTWSTHSFTISSGVHPGLSYSHNLKLSPFL